MKRFSIINAVEFSRLLGDLVHHAFHDLDMQVMVTEVQRFSDRQAMLVNMGASKTMNSDHLVCCAADIDVVVGGQTIKDGSHPAYKMLAIYWKSLSPNCYWGGDYREIKDSRHFGYRVKEAA